MDRFLIADNPMNEGSTSALIHTIEPLAIIELLEGHVKCRSPYRWFEFVNNDGILEEWTLRVHHLMTSEFDSEKHHLIVTRLLDRALHWYQAYMKWEDNQLNIL